MNRDRCLECLHRAYLHDDRATPIGHCAPAPQPGDGQEPLW